MKAIQIILFQAKKQKVKDLCDHLSKSIETGEPFYKVAAKLPKIFTVFDVAILEMWDATGQIGRSFEIIATKEEREADLSRKIKAALIYPMTIVFVAVSMVTVIMTYVVPKIEGMYREANVNLPGITQWLIDVSHFIQNNLLLLVILIGWGIIGGMYALKNRIARKWFDTNILKIFLFGNIIKKRVLITFCEFLSTLLNSGILINKALLIVKNGIGNVYYEDEIMQIIEEIKAGKTLSSTMWSDLIERQSGDLSAPENKAALELAIRRNDFFPIELWTAVKIGEQTGTLGKMLDRVSARYNKEVDGVIKNLSAMLEPIIIMVLGVVVGTMILAIMLPFFNMVNVVK